MSRVCVWIASGALAGVALVAAGGAAAQRLQDDPRSALAPAPASLQDVAAAFVPTWEPLVEPRALQIPDEGETSSQVAVEEGVCYAAVGFSASVADLDVWVRMDGMLVAQEVQRDAYPVARWCAGASGFVDIALSAYTTGGDAWLGVWVDPESIERGGGGGGLRARMDGAMARSAPRWRVDGALWIERITQIGTRAREVRFDEPGCRGFLAVGTPGIGDLDLTLRDASGGIVASDLALDPTPALVYCAPAPGTYRIEATAALGGGWVAVQRLLPPLE